MNSPMNLQVGGLGLLWLIGILIPFGPVFSEVVASYDAPANPVSSGSGWASAGRAALGTPVEKPETAWRIAPVEGAALSYFFREPREFLSNAFAKGWKLSARLRLDTGEVKSVGRYVASLGVENKDKNEAFVLWVRTSEGEPGLLAELNGKPFPLPGLAVDAFHNYAMTYDPVSSTVSLQVDGETVAGNIAAARTERWFLRWGHSSVTAKGIAEWASVNFEVPPFAKH